MDDRQVSDIDLRLKALEQFRHEAEMRDARAEEREKAHLTWMKSIDKSLSEQREAQKQWADDQRKNNIWLIRLVSAIVVGAIIKFILEGGLSNVG